MDDTKDLIVKMGRYSYLKTVITRADLAAALEVSPVFLTKVLYRTSPENAYYSFSIPKKNGGKRLINAPNDELKDLQSRLSMLLLDCLDAINSEIDPSTKKRVRKESKISHGFERDKSIITNARKHRKKRNVLNIDINNYFQSFNFGRVRGFFIKNRNFLLDEKIATTIAQIACFNNGLPQGSPCSPVISNLIFHSLDIRLSKLAKRHSLTYSRYADDLSFSTNKNNFPDEIVCHSGGRFISGYRLRSEIEKAGFEINESKTRVQFKSSRQDVTGLVVNDKVNVKREYWRLERAKCHYLFMTGDIADSNDVEDLNGKLKALYGRLNFIDTLDRYNRYHAASLEHNIVSRSSVNGGLKRESDSVLVRETFDKKSKPKLLNSREKNFSRFIFFMNFYFNSSPVILSEGKTDNVYIKTAIEMLMKDYPNLTKLNAETKKMEVDVSLFNYTKRTRYLLNLYGGGNYLKNFVADYCTNYKYFKAPALGHPVIIIVDNDKGPNELISFISSFVFKSKIKTEDIRKKDFLHIFENLYLILTPLGGKSESCMEDLFDSKTKSIKLNGKTFDPDNENSTATTYGKHVFSVNVVRGMKKSISFDLFKILLDRISNAIEYNKSREPAIKSLM